MKHNRYPQKNVNIFSPTHYHLYTDHNQGNVVVVPEVEATAVVVKHESPKNGPCNSSSNNNSTVHPRSSARARRPLLQPLLPPTTRSIRLTSPLLPPPPPQVVALRLVTLTRPMVTVVTVTPLPDHNRNATPTTPTSFPTLRPPLRLRPP